MGRTERVGAVLRSGRMGMCIVMGGRLALAWVVELVDLDGIGLGVVDHEYGNGGGGAEGGEEGYGRGIYRRRGVGKRAGREAQGARTMGAS